MQLSTGAQLHPRIICEEKTAQRKNPQTPEVSLGGTASAKRTRWRPAAPAAAPAPASQLVCFSLHHACTYRYRYKHGQGPLSQSPGRAGPGRHSPHLQRFITGHHRPSPATTPRSARALPPTQGRILLPATPRGARAERGPTAAGTLRRPRPPPPPPPSARPVEGGACRAKGGNFRLWPADPAPHLGLGPAPKPMRVGSGSRAGNRPPNRKAAARRGQVGAGPRVSSPRPLRPARQSASAAARPRGCGVERCREGGGRGAVRAGSAGGGATCPESGAGCGTRRRGLVPCPPPPTPPIRAAPA